MEDGHKEEQQDAIPVDTERRTGSQRHRILPVGTVVQDDLKKISSTHSVFSPDVAGFDSKVHPNDFVRGNGRLGRPGGSSDKNFFKTEIATATEVLVQVDMKMFPLRFRDTTQEEAFCKHFNMYVAGKVRSASRIVILVHAVMLIAQYLTQARVHHNFVFITRAAVILLSLSFQTMISTSWFRRHLERLLLVHYLVLDVVHQLPRFAFLMSSTEEETDEAANDENKIEELKLFASQKSVRAMNLIFIVVIYIASGMRFNMASICACWHIAIKFFFAVVFCHACTWDDLDATTNCSMIAFCTLTAYHGERYVRQEFVVRLKVDEERKRRDDLLETMLPVHIKERLKDNCTDGLVESYDEVSILFCYVSNFQALSKNASAIELVQLMNRIVFCFDSATDAHEVYKVEAIAETYMCAAGVPQRDPFHCEKVAEMALTMMQICEKESWNFNGVDIQLQIGIHSGPVVAGVVGSKTYSYHLFGDTVNTSSRVCSSGCAGKIQISARSHQLLAQNGSFVISERGLVNLKGKGMVQLFWLEGKATLASRRKLAVPDIYNDFETVTEESIRAKDLEYKSPLHHRSDVYLSCMKDVEIQWATLDFRQKIPCKYEEQWLKFRGRSSRVQAAPDKVSSLKSNSKSAKDPHSSQNVKDTASEMENAFRFEHARDSTPQFCMGLCMSVVYLVITIIYRTHTTNNDPNKAARSARAYSIYGITIAVLLSIVKLLRTYPRLARLKEKWGTGTGLVFVSALNIQLLTASNTFKDSQPRGQQKITYLDGNILYAVIAGLAMRLRFRNAALINTWGYVAFVICHCLRHHEVWADLSEGFYLLFVTSWIAIHFGYKRELGLRHDFLLKCTLQLEKQKCEDLLTNMLPSKQYAEALMQQSTIVDELAEVTLLYSDMVGFTPLGAKLDPEAICVMLNHIYSAFDSHLDDLGVYKMDTVGDAFIVVGGLPGHKSSKNHAAAIAAFAVEMLREIERFCAKANVELQMRIGIHTGPVVGGVVGIKKPRYLIWGKHTVIANLMESRGVPGLIQLSDTAYTYLRKCPEFMIEERADRVQISENDTMRTYFLVPEHPTVKDAIVSHYLDVNCLENTPDVYAFQELQTCLLPSSNTSLSKPLELSLNSRKQSDLATSLEDSLPPPLAELAGR